MTNETHIRIEGKWELEDFGVFSQHYTQCYALLYSLNEENALPIQREIDFEYSKFPWRGGYSVVHFYYSLYHRIPWEDRPNVKRISYSSPGSMDLNALRDVTLQISAIVGIIVAGALGIEKVYSRMMKGMHERKLARIEIAAKDFQLTKDQVEFATNSLDEFSRALGLSPKVLAILERRTKGSKLVQLKVLQSLYRRAVPLADLTKREMLFLDSTPSDKNRKGLPEKASNRERDGFS